MSAPEISVVCAVGDHMADLAATHAEFVEALANSGRSVEFVYVLDGPRRNAEALLGRIVEGPFPVRVLRLAQGFGESTALRVGFEQARGRFVLTVPDRPQIDANVLRDVLARLEAGDEAVVTRREPRVDALFNRIQSRVFHGVVRSLVGQEFHDMTCCVRGFTIEAARRLDLYGDQHRFIPVIAARLGYAVTELPAEQHEDNRGLRLRRPGIYARRLLDLLNMYFLSRFTRKPLRFFGLVGMAIGAAGGAILSLLAAQRLLAATPLAGRPLLLLGVLLVILGVQVVSIGLLGEMIIFQSARRDNPGVLREEEQVRERGPD